MHLLNRPARAALCLALVSLAFASAEAAREQGSNENAMTPQLLAQVRHPGEVGFAPPVDPAVDLPGMVGGDAPGGEGRNQLTQLQFRQIDEGHPTTMWPLWTDTVRGFPIAGLGRGVL